MLMNVLSKHGEIEMRAVKTHRITTIITLAVAGVLFLTAGSIAQIPLLKKKHDKTAAKTAVSKNKSAPLPAPSGTPTDDKTGDGKLADGDDTILPYYNNYLKEYRLGPSDQISVEVFGQCPDYCKTGITVPPNARISYPLIREGVLVAGKTVEQIAAEITKKLDEYIIDPKVTVTLDKAMATRYAVMGSVGQPGVRVMDKKVSVYEAILEAGGVTKNGDRNKVYVVSFGKDGRLSRKQLSLNQMEAGKTDMVFLNPGDQVFVAGRGFTIEKFFAMMSSASSARVLLGLP